MKNLVNTFLNIRLDEQFIMSQIFDKVDAETILRIILKEAVSEDYSTHDMTTAATVVVPASKFFPFSGGYVNVDHVVRVDHRENGAVLKMTNGEIVYLNRADVEKFIELY